MKLISVARYYYEAVVSGLQAKRAMNTALPSKVATGISPRDKFLLCRENEGEKLYKFLYRDGRLSMLIGEKCSEHLFENSMPKLRHAVLVCQKYLNPLGDFYSDTVPEITFN